MTLAITSPRLPGRDDRHDQDPPPCLADVDTLRDLVHARRIDAVILDLDGTLRSNGSWLGGAAELLHELAQLGVPHVLLTNDASCCAQEKAQQLQQAGVACAVEHIITCADLTLDHLRQRGWVQADLVGRLGQRAPADVAFNTVVPGQALQHDVLVLGSGAVLSDGLLSSWCARPPAHCLVSNADLIWQPQPGVVAACPGLLGQALDVLAHAMGQRVEFIECGKPSRQAFRQAYARLVALARRPLATGRVAVFGDSPYSDIVPAARMQFFPVPARTGLWRFHGE